MRNVDAEGYGPTVTPLFGAGGVPSNAYGKGIINEENAIVRALVVQPGDYRFHLEPVMSHIWQYETRPETNTFSVGPREIKFVGAFYVTSCKGNVEIRDTSERDVPKLRELSPTIDVSKVIVEIVEFEALED
ncbi:MAG: hypothetical protein QNJ14_18975 [Woeseiaceae bacterium]|nr:hypothetical protein [Woeseiaceae bacterium]